MISYCTQGESPVVLTRTIKLFACFQPFLNKRTQASWGYTSYKDPSEPHKELHTDLERIEACADTWLVSFNTSKTKELLISNACHMRAHPVLVFEGEALKWLDAPHLLGANFSSDLSWTEHLSIIRSSCSKKLGVILRSKVFSLMSLFCHFSFRASDLS